jgi:hypothetical protein
LIVASDGNSITLANGIVIECVANSFRSVRGPTVVCAVFEELAFWYSEYSANPDMEVLRAIRPSMLTVPGALLLGISSPYSRRGLLFEKYKKHFGKDGSKVLIWKASTKVMNPQVDQGVIDEAYADDPVAAAAEYGGEFRSDVETFISVEAIEAVISQGVRERTYVPGFRYVGFCDPAGGGGQDSMTLGIAHLEKDVAVLDAIREIKPRFSPESAVEEFAGLLKSYKVTKIQGDKYAGEWPTERFRKCGIFYEAADQPKSDIYRDALPLINSGKVALLDIDRLKNQFIGLERKTARSGRDSIDHAPGGHDDVCNAGAGALVSLTKKKSSYNLENFFRLPDGSLEDVRSMDSINESWRQGKLQRFMFSGGRFGG